ncbi:MAG: DUF3783 domain-containing protein [Spirochaetales bacterium]|jgi:hypothetical protein|nr:DUF3783 domain-containing protein [Spirochaetales bacterium]
MKTLILHDFSKDEVFKIMDLVKTNWPDPKEIAFAMTTPLSVKRKLKAVLNELEEEHKYFRKNEQETPGGAK